MNSRIFIFLIPLFLACSTSTQAKHPVPFDLLPMYGGMDRSTIPELKAADEELIAGTTAYAGSREKAAEGFLNNGFIYYQQDDLDNAMRRFNQAWLLDPQNPEVYAGFASVLHDQGKNCEAMEMMEKALALDSTPVWIYPDAARVITLCAVDDKALSGADKANMFERSEALYRKAEETDQNKGYLYASWATAYYWRGQYAEAWSMVAKAEESGGGSSGGISTCHPAHFPIK